MPFAPNGVVNARHVPHHEREGQRAARRLEVREADADATSVGSRQNVGADLQVGPTSVSID